MVSKALFSSNSDEWTTPLELFRSLDQEFNFELDPCSTDKNHLCPFYITKEENGLVMDWQKLTTFCNPPYSQIKSWVKKCFEEYEKGSTVVLLIPSRTDTSYFHDFILPYCELRFIRGRLKFGNSKNSAPFPSLIAIYRNGK